MKRNEKSLDRIGQALVELGAKDLHKNRFFQYKNIRITLNSYGYILQYERDDETITWDKVYLQGDYYNGYKTDTDRAKKILEFCLYMYLLYNSEKI